MLGHKMLRWLQRQSVRYYMGRMRVGKRVSIKGGLSVHKPHNVTLGDDVRINANVVLHAHAPIHIGSFTMIASGCIVVTANHDLARRGLEAFERLQAAPVNIGSNCWLGAGVIVLPGVSIGDGTVVGAGSVVARDLPPERVCVGAPATPIRPRPGEAAEGQ